MWPIVRDALAGAPPDVRTQIRWMAGLWALLVAGQIWDSADSGGAGGFAELAGALLAATGAALLGLAFSLQRTLERSPAAAAGAGAIAGLQEILIALPAIGFAAGVALGGAAMAMLVRVVLGVEWPLAAVGLTLYVVLIAVAGRTVVRSARTLFEHATRQAGLVSEARAEAADARLFALQARMNPHVLFNALNTIAALVRSDPPRAEHVVEDLSDVLRATLRRTTSTMTTLGDEVDYVRAYLAIEQARRGERLAVVWDVPADLRHERIPTLAVQPLVENALVHGLSGIEGGTIRIAASRRGEHLELVIEDDGEGFGAGWREGTGLGNLRQRLATIYGRAASIDTTNSARGARVTVRVPRTAAAQAE
jgi:sensor histidine kinase YesM